MISKNVLLVTYDLQQRRNRRRIADQSQRPGRIFSFLPKTLIATITNGFNQGSDRTFVANSPKRAHNDLPYRIIANSYHIPSTPCDDETTRFTVVFNIRYKKWNGRRGCAFKCAQLKCGIGPFSRIFFTQFLN